MCIQIVERYAACGCLYYEHAIDACEKFGRHAVRESVAFVGFKCPNHPHRSKELVLGDSSDEESDSISQTSTLVAGDDIIDEIMFALASDEVLQHLWPHLFSGRYNDTATAELNVAVLLRNWGQDLRKAAQAKPGKLEEKVSHFIRSRSRPLAIELRKHIENKTEQLDQRQIQIRTEGYDPDQYENSDPEDVDESIVDRFEDVRDFCLKGEAFLNLRFNAEMYVAHMTTSNNTRVFDSAIISVKNLLDRFRIKEKPQSATRLDWTCSCGRRITDDYIVNEPDALIELHQFLQHTRKLSIAANSRSKRTFSSFSGGVTALVSTFTGFFKKTSRPVLPRSNVSESTPGKCPASPPGGGFHDFILFCIPFMRSASMASNAEICRLQSDRDFFKLMRWHYNKNRGRFLPQFCLKKVTALNFVRFEMYHDDFADIQLIPPEVTPGSNPEYAYTPMPAAMIPPIGPALLLHFYENPTHASILPTLLAKIPKKLKAPLTPCPIKGSSVGWGIQIHEGFHWFVFFGYCGAAFVLCAMVGGVWAGVKGDVQGGFGVAGFLMAGVGVLGGLVHAGAVM